MLKPHIVIIGGGFGGVYAARSLQKEVRRGRLRLTLINRTNYFLFTPLLHEVATGSLTPQSVIEPLRELFAGTDTTVMQADVDAIDVGHRVINTSRGDIAFDAVLLATGASSNDYSVPGVAEHAVPLKTLEDALDVRRRVISSVERCRDHPAQIVIVGGGPTGVELAAEINEFVHSIAQRDGPRASAEVTLISGAPDLLNHAFGAPLRKTAERHLRSKGVNVLLDRSVARVEATGVVLSDSTTVPADVVIWTAGVAPVLPNIIGAKIATERGRILVNDQLQAVGSERVFALGDVAATPAALPMLAQVAVAQAGIAAHNAAALLTGRPLRTLRYQHKGNLLSLGNWFAIGEIGPLHLQGRFAWWLWRTVYLFKFITWKKRFRIAFEWTLNIFTRRDTSNFA